MPNYCENELFVRGNDIIRFYEENQNKNDGTDDSLRHIHEELSFMKSVSTNGNECVKIWGTKWDACDTNASLSETEIYYFFHTAWTPPVAWLRAVAAKYPTLDFELEAHEAGVDFYIHLIIENGVEVLYEESTYTEYLRKKHNLDEIIEKIFQHKKAARKCRSIIKHEGSLEEYFEDDECDEELRELVEELDSSDAKDALFYLIQKKIEDSLPNGTKKS